MSCFSLLIVGASVILLKERQAGRHASQDTDPNPGGGAKEKAAYERRGGDDDKETGKGKGMRFGIQRDA
eukprot:793477-Pleurochrysis_carterae.AAC.3